MIVGKFTTKWDHGTSRNTEDDLGISVAPVETVDGKVIRGIGSNYISKEAAERDKRLSIERGRVARSLDRLFLKSPIEGLYVIPSKEEFNKRLAELNPSPEINARGVVYTLEAGERNTDEIEAWITTIKNQLKFMPKLGKGKEAKTEGLETIERLAQCPALSEDTRNQILSLVGQARLEQIERTDFRRRIAELDIQLDAGAQGPVTIAPRRAPVADTTEPESAESMLSDAINTYERRVS